MRIKEKRRIVQLLRLTTVDTILEKLKSIPGTKVINPLFAGLCSTDEVVRWHAITAMGSVVADIADREMETARIIMRRLMWSLNDESGGIGWGAPEAMAEIMSCHRGIAEEYSHMLVSYMREDGNFQEHEIMQRGVLWGVARLAQAWLDLMQKWNATHYTMPYLASNDAFNRGLAIWALDQLHSSEAHAPITNLLHDTSEVRFYWNRSFITETVGQLAAKALANST